MSVKIALITGGNRGLGRNAALKLAEKGTDIVLTWRNHHSEAEAVVEEIRALGRRAVALQLDVADCGQFDGFIAQLKSALSREWQRESFDFLLNNAGHGHYTPFSETSEEQFDALLNVHFKGPYFLTQKLLPLIANGGRILNVSTALTRMTYPGSGTYAAIKSAVEVLTRYQAQELGARGIRVNVLAPGAVETDFGEGRIRNNPTVRETLSGFTALGRVGQPDDIGNVITLLLSDESGWINGQRIEASGGQSL